MRHHMHDFFRRGAHFMGRHHHGRHGFGRFGGDSWTTAARAAAA